MASNATITARQGEVERALERQELVLHFQPKAELRTGLIPGVEALVRWCHPVRGLLPPAELLPAVEAAGLLDALTDWVLDAALAQRAAWARDGQALAVAVNVAPATVLAPGFADRVSAALARHRVPAPALAIEVTEGALMLDHEAAATVLGRLRTLGVGLSIDDFGTGWSSLARLRRLPFDEVKIDRSFVAGMGVDEDDRAIVRVVVDLARHFDRRVVAEGVEHGDQLAWLAALGCDVVQGFHLSPPLPAGALGEWLARWREGAGDGGPQRPGSTPGRRRQAQRLALRRLAGATAARTGELGEEELLEGLAEALGWPVAALWTLDVAEQALQCVACVTRRPLAVPDFERLTRALAYRRGTGLPGSVWDDGAPRWLADVPAAGRLSRAEAARSAGLRGAIAVPVRSAGRFAGVVELYSDEREPAAPALLAEIAALAEGPLGEALVAAGERRVRTGHDRAAEAVVRAHELLSTGGDPGRTRTIVCEALAAITGAGAVLLFEPDGDALTMTAASGYDGPPPSIGLTGETSAVVAAWSSRRGTFIGHLDSSPAASARLVRCIGAGAGLFEPLVVGEEAVGAVAVTWAQHRCRPPADVRRAVHGLLAHAAPVLAGGARRAA